MARIVPVQRIRNFCDAIRPLYQTTVVDVGANPFAGTPPYGVLRRSDRSHVIGFEPQPQALASLIERARWNDKFLPYAIGDGGAGELFITKNSGLVSTLRPLPQIGRLLGPWWERAIRVKDVLPIKTKRLDDIVEIERVDFLKIDIQGGELNVFKGGRKRLRNCAAIQTEVCFHPYYENQPSFGEINAELLDQGFIFHKFVEMSAHPIGFDEKFRGSKIKPTQVTVGDAIYVKDVTEMSVLSDSTVQQLAIVSMSVFHSYDLCLRCLTELQHRGLLDERRAKEAAATVVSI